MLLKRTGVVYKRQNSGGPNVEPKTVSISDFFSA